jgi:hypothetical protein
VYQQASNGRNVLVGFCRGYLNAHELGVGARAEN